ncbi:MAG: hypothetical protein Q9218_007118 [Villophora microphyllina]
MPSLSPIQIALALEAGLNIFGATFMLLLPRPILSFLSSPPSRTASDPNPTSVSPTATQLLRWLAVLVYGLTPQLLLALPASRSARDKRWIAYVTLGAGEGALIVIMLWQALVRESGEGGLTRRALLGCAAGLAPFMVWRIYVLGGRPGMLAESGPKRE